MSKAAHNPAASATIAPFNTRVRGRVGGSRYAANEVLGLSLIRATTFVGSISFPRSLVGHVWIIATPSRRGFHRATPRALWANDAAYAAIIAFARVVRDESGRSRVGEFQVILTPLDGGRLERMNGRGWRLAQTNRPRPLDNQISLPRSRIVLPSPATTERRSALCRRANTFLPGGV
jgi:hypothetical protein